MFRFKQFAIRQDRCPMKVGTDGVLLGAWVSVRPSDRRILDIGTGTGLIALMMAQRVPGARITGVDVEDISQARENADASPWGGRVAFVQCPVQEFAPQGKFDLVVSNPPFFVDSLTCPDAGRTTARHAVRLPFGDLRDAVVRLLSDEGHFAVVLPADEAARFIGICRDVLLPVRRTDVRTTPRHAAKRVLLEFVRTPSGDVFPPAAASPPSGFSAAGSGLRSDDPAALSDAVPLFSVPSVPAPDRTELVIGTGVHEQYTPEYRSLTRDFYLKF
ncbi:tRNA1(Val) (adenine(37)-N6)-methyltransferase [Alistipes onderdonkii]|uniref:tRNA1(Val) (adenine(37)-N6)-methyltransferase n=1 Tax=Alistipes onderdonkii TaxID=328813 RepID=UPI001874491A|nr:methyltransferase [Alistipes onderdonkii]MBE5048380.1 methyltransferase [Alistipes onderdonkii]